MESGLSCHKCKLPALSLRGHEQKPADNARQANALVGAGTHQSPSEANPLSCHIRTHAAPPIWGNNGQVLGSGELATHGQTWQGKTKTQERNREHVKSRKVKQLSHTAR